MSAKYGEHFSTISTPQSEAIPSSPQVPNSAGGFSFQVDDWTQLDRFLILGAEGGTYYVGERELVKNNAQAVLSCIAQDGKRVVERVVSVSLGGQAPKNDPAIFVLALCAATENVNTRRAAFDALPSVCRIFTHLATFMTYVKGFRGRGKLLHKAIQRWYLDKTLEKLAYQAIKYRNREGFTHRDMLRIARPKTLHAAQNDLLRWMVGKSNAPVGLSRELDGYTMIQGCTEVREAVRIITEYQLTHEMVPEPLKAHAEVWRALLPHMPFTAMIRNLGNLSSHGLLGPLSEGESLVCAKLGDAEGLTKARVHPLAVLVASAVFQQGHGVRGGKSWQTNARVLDALSQAFYLSFGNVTPSNKRIMLALDVSGSMFGNLVAGIQPLDAALGSAAMALVTARVEPHHFITAFSAGGPQFRSTDGLCNAGISPHQRLDDVLHTTRSLSNAFKGTDCALPMLWAAENKIEVDAFIVYTDSETWFGSIHPTQALKQYRQKFGIPSKLIVVGMCSNQFTIADPRDVGMLDVVGFDTSAPQVMGDFIR